MNYIKNIIKKHRTKSMILVVAVTICNLLALLYNYCFKFVIDSIEQKNMNSAWANFILLLTLQILVTAVTLLVYDYYLRIFQKSVERDVRNDIISEILTWPFSKSKNITPGSLSTLMTEDVSQIGEYVSLYDFMILANSIRFLITYALLFTLDKVIGIVVLVSVPLYYFCTKFTMGPMRKFVEDGYNSRDRLNNFFLDILNNMMNVKSYKIENIVEKSIADKTYNLYEKEKNLQKWKAIFYFIRNFLTSFMPAAILGLSIARIINGDMTLGTLVAINGFSDAVYLPISELFYFKSMKNNLKPVVERIDPIFDKHIDKLDKRKVSFGKTAIITNNLSYSYGEMNIIENVNLTLEGNGLYKIDGKNGAGKSTFLNIVSGLYNDYSGEINIRVQSNLPNISYMNQKDILFDADIFDNVSLFKNLSLNKITATILKKFEKRKGKITEFSGGEKRLILFLRVINTNASIYLFDEPFEGVDATMKIEMKRIISELAKEKLVLIVSHEDEILDDMDYKNIILK